MKNKRVPTLLITAIIMVCCAAALQAQKFEGTFTYTVSYIAKAKDVKSKDLIAQFGNYEAISMSNNWCRQDRKLDDKVLKTYVCDNVHSAGYLNYAYTNYWLKGRISSDISKKIVKLDTSAMIGKYKCDVYRFTKTAAKITFYVSTETLAGKNAENIWFTIPGGLKGPVVKLVLENNDYMMIEELTDINTNPPDAKLFDVQNLMPVVNADELTSRLLDQGSRKDVQHCLYKNIGYPNYLSLYNIEGKVWVELVVDNTGKLKNTDIKVDYFKKAEQSIRIYDAGKIKNLTVKTKKKLLPVVESCLKDMKFEPPVLGSEKVNALIRIPIIFSHAAADMTEENADIDEADVEELFYDDYDEYY